MSRGDQYKTVWTSRVKSVSRSWGEEIMAGSLGTCTMKVLLISAGRRTSLKYYQRKNEVLLVRKGKIKVEYDSEKYHWQEEASRKFKTATLIEGDVLFVQSQCPYRITAIDDSEIVEIGDVTHDKSVKIDEHEET